MPDPLFFRSDKEMGGDSGVGRQVGMAHEEWATEEMVEIVVLVVPFLSCATVCVRQLHYYRSSVSPAAVQYICVARRRL